MNIDFENLGFNYIKLPYRFRAYWKNGEWGKKGLEESEFLQLHEGATSLHYAQETFEGLKAYRTATGEVQLFRPLENAHRLQNSANKMKMAEVTDELFLEGIIETVKANIDFVPPRETNASLYLRPFEIGDGENIGVKAAPEYVFSVFGTPVGPYYKGGLQPGNFIVADDDRAAANGTGNVKVGGNYAASLSSVYRAKDAGFTDTLFLDPIEHKYIDEFSGANFFGITKDGKFVTPKSSSILPSITKKSIMQIALDLGMEVVEAKIPIESIADFIEAGAMGTAAVITPVGSITYSNKVFEFNNGEVGEITKKLYNTLVGIQYGDIEDKHNWIYPISNPVIS
jgi:branched-chain amino acid aminotransferase